MLVLVYTHERELRSHIHALRSANLLSEEVNIAVKLTGIPGRISHGSLDVDGLTFLDRRLFLNFGTAIDWTSWLTARHFIRRLKKKFPEIQSMVVGELAGPKALMALCAKAEGLRTILVPEGINIFRRQFGGYRWRDLTWKQGLGSRARYSYLVWNDLKRKNRVNLRLAALLSVQILRALISGLGAPRGSKSSTLDNVDLTISKWSKDVAIPVESGSKIHLYSAEKSGSSYIPNRSQSRTAMILQSPEEIDREDWGKVLMPVLQGVATVLIRWHRVDIGREELKAAVENLGLEVKIDKDSGPLELRDFSELPDVFIGSRSGALLDLACRYPSARVVCLADSIKAVAKKRGREIPGYADSHLLEALKTHANGRIHFL